MIPFKRFRYLIPLPVLWAIYIWWRFQVGVPFGDDWSAINGLVLRFQSGQDGFWAKCGLLIAQCNEHREGFLGTMVLLSYALQGYLDYSWYNFVGVLGSIATLLLFLRASKQQGLPAAMGLPLALMLMNASFYQNWHWPTAALQHGTVAFFGLWALQRLEAKAWVGALALSALSVFTSGNGFLIFIAAWPLLRGEKPRRIGLWLAWGLALLALYLWGYQSPAHRQSLSENLQLPVALLGTFLAYLGSFMAAFFPEGHAFRLPISLFTGTLLALFLIWRLWPWVFANKIPNRSPWLAAVQIFVLATVALYALSRAHLPKDLVFESRYGINTAILLASIFLDVQQSRFKTWLWYACTLFAGSLFLFSYFWGGLHRLNFNQANAAAFLRNKVLERDFYFDPKSNAQKLDLNRPDLESISSIPKPLVDFSADIPEAGRYYNNVIRWSFKQGLVRTPMELMPLEQALGRSGGPLPQNWKFTLAEHGIQYHAPKLTWRASNAIDGYYLVLDRQGQASILYSMFWNQVDVRQQVLHPNQVAVRALGGGIPFVFLPDGRYTLRVILLESGKTQVFQVPGEFLVKGL